VESQGGFLFPRNGQDRRVPFAEVAARAFDEDTLPRGMTPGLEFASEYTLVDAGFPYGAQVVMVEVERDTGEVKLLGQFAVHDQGKIMNPILVEGQHHGGIAQGIGQALTEEMSYDWDGQPLASTFMDYGMPVAEGIPEPVLDNLEIPSPTNPLQAKGAGEIATTGTAGVIANAVVDALAPFGVRHIDTPLTPEKIWRIIRTSAPKSH
jgi:carbon-monoxide dehydrogenase large subunit